MLTGSLCTGYGGLDAALHEVLGGELAWVADIDPGASAILAHRFPSVPNLGNISKTDWSVIEPVDVLTAGFPCQDVSCAGGHAGLNPFHVSPPRCKPLADGCAAESAHHRPGLRDD